MERTLGNETIGDQLDAQPIFPTPPDAEDDGDGEHSMTPAEILGLFFAGAERTDLMTFGDWALIAQAMCNLFLSPPEKVLVQRAIEVSREAIAVRVPDFLRERRSGGGPG